MTLEQLIEEKAFPTSQQPSAPMVIRIDDLRELFDGKVLIDANKDASCEAAMEHEFSTMQATVSSYKSPGEALRALIDWHCAVAIDPKVNGGKALVPVEPTDAMIDALFPGTGTHTCRELYKSMLAASQEQGK
jgi:hypothetical protein